jgi:hypothetical protein
MDEKVIEAARAAFPADAARITLGAPIHGGVCHGEPLVRDVARQMTRSLFGALAGPTRRRSTRRRSR